MHLKPKGGISMVVPTLSGTQTHPGLCSVVSRLHECNLVQCGCQSSCHHIRVLSISMKEGRGARCAPTFQEELLQVSPNTSLTTKEPLDLAGKSCAQLKIGALLNWRELGRELAVSARLWEGYYLISHKPWCE